MAAAPAEGLLILALSDAGIAAIVGAVLSGTGALLAGVAAVIGAKNRREVHSRDANGFTLRDEVQNVERMLGEHVRQTEEMVTRIGRDRDAIVEWLRRKMEQER